MKFDSKEDAFESFEFVESFESFEFFESFESFEISTKLPAQKFVG